MVIAEVRSADVPMEVLGLDVKREGIGKDLIERGRKLFDGMLGEVGRRIEGRGHLAARIEGSDFVVHGVTLRNLNGETGATARTRSAEEAERFASQRVRPCSSSNAAFHAKFRGMWHSCVPGRRPSHAGSNRHMPNSAYVQSAVFLIIAAVALFGSAGTSRDHRLLALSRDSRRRHRGVASDPRSRSHPRAHAPGRTTAAARAYGCSRSSSFLHWVIAGLDRGRFHWSDGVPGLAAGHRPDRRRGGYALRFWAMGVNRFFSSVVRIQTDRGQHVVTTGPYGCIRHPGYLAGIVIIVGQRRGARIVARDAVLLCSRACRFCSTARSRKIACCTPSCRAIATTPAESAGVSCREFGETEQGFPAR